MTKFKVGDKVLCLHKTYDPVSMLVLDSTGLHWKENEDTRFFRREAIIHKTYKQVMEEHGVFGCKDDGSYELKFLDDGSTLAWVTDDELVLLEKAENNIMAFREYQEDAIRTITGISAAHNDNLLLEGVMGLNGESGEVIEPVKKHMFQGHPLDKEHIALELSDILWYLTVSAHAIGYSLEDIATLNIQKRKSRYPQGFDKNDSLNREEKSKINLVSQ